MAILTATVQPKDARDIGLKPMTLEGDDPKKPEIPQDDDTNQEVETGVVEEETETQTVEDDETQGDETGDKDTEAKTKDEPEEDWTVTIGEPEEEDEDDQPEKKAESSTIREMRRKLRKAQSENKRLKKDREKKDVEAELPPLGEKPTLEDFEYDEERYEEAVVAYTDRKRQHDKKASEIKTRNENAQKRHDKKLETYQARKKEIMVEVPDFEDAEDHVRNALSETNQAILVAATNDPTVMVLALGTKPKMLEKLKAIDDPIAFAAEVARLEARLKVNDKSNRAKPERRVKRGTAATDGLSSDKQLERLEAEADKTGDRTAVQAYKRKMRESR